VRVLGRGQSTKHLEFCSRHFVIAAMSVRGKRKATDEVPAPKRQRASRVLQPVVRVAKRTARGKRKEAIDDIHAESSVEPVSRGTKKIKCIQALKRSLVSRRRRPKQETTSDTTKRKREENEEQYPMRIKKEKHEEEDCYYGFSYEVAEELLLNILSFLIHPIDVNSASRVCKKWCVYIPVNLKLMHCGYKESRRS